MSDETKKPRPEDPVFSDRGSPALLSLKEPALRMLRERYAETFAITSTKEKQIHLFVIKYSMWSLIRTFVPKDLGAQEIQISNVLALLENALNGSESGKILLDSLDKSVGASRERIAAKVREYGIGEGAQKGI